MSLSLGVAAGVVFALLVGRMTTTGPTPAVVGPQGAQPSAAQPEAVLYTSGTVVLERSPGGTALATVAPATPMLLLGAQGAWVRVGLDLYRTAASPTILYQDPVKLLRAGVLAAPDAAQQTGTITVAGSPWQRVHLVGWIQRSATSTDLNTLWSQAASSYEHACGACHSLHDAAEFTARQWLSQFRAMVPRTPLTQEQADLILKWLQAHSKGQ